MAADIRRDLEGVCGPQRTNTAYPLRARRGKSLQDPGHVNDQVLRLQLLMDVPFCGLAVCGVIGRAAATAPMRLQPFQGVRDTTGAGLPEFFPQMSQPTHYPSSSVPISTRAYPPSG